MHCWSDLSQIPPEFGPSVVTIGNFDGVHRGHQEVLQRLVRLAKREHAQAVVVTFDPHPLVVHRPQIAPEPLISLSDKLDLMRNEGVDGVLVQPYTMEFAQQTPEDFVRDYLAEPFGARGIVIGADVRFGWRNTGDLHTMQTLGKRLGFRVEVVDDAAGASADGRRWSSTWVRELLADGDVAGAAQVLGRWHTMRGIVVRGDRRGRELGFPTANLSQDATGMKPADGVYAGWMLRPELPTDHPDAVLPASISIGSNPTFAGSQRRVEAYVPGRTDLDLYGESIALEFVTRLRHTLRFSDVSGLVTQMHDDVRATVHALRGGHSAPVVELR